MRHPPTTIQESVGKSATGEESGRNSRCEGRDLLPTSSVHPPWLRSISQVSRIWIQGGPEAQLMNVWSGGACHYRLAFCAHRTDRSQIFSDRRQKQIAYFIQYPIMAADRTGRAVVRRGDRRRWLSRQRSCRANWGSGSPAMTTVTESPTGAEADRTGTGRSPSIASPAVVDIPFHHRLLGVSR